MSTPIRLAILTLFPLLSVACADTPTQNPAPASAAEPAIAGVWRAVISSPGGELPFTLRIDSEGGELQAVVLNGAEEAPLSSVEQEGVNVLLHFDWYDSEITADLDAGGEAMTGTWRKTAPKGDSTLAFAARRDDPRRFLPADTTAPIETPVSDVTGHWVVEFRDEDGAEVARGELVQSGADPTDANLTGTFLTPTGDYRFLAGSFEHGRLRLSTFDGAHAFLFDATAREDGTLAGDFWSRDTYHATWIARRAEENQAILPDAWTAVSLTNEDGVFSFTFPDLDATPVSLTDPRFDGKAVLVNIFGSWCPNCNDEAPLLAEWHRRYRDRGLEIVGLAYEFTGDLDRDRQLVRRFAERYAIEYPLLLAGVSDKAAAASTLPDLTAVIAYPTTIFIGRDGKVRKIHTGFTGPGTGSHYQQLVAELEAAIEELLAEPA